MRSTATQVSCITLAVGAVLLASAPARTAPPDPREQQPRAGRTYVGEQLDPATYGDTYMEDMEAVPMTVLINPEIEVLDDEMTTGVEGCLSLPGMIGIVPRFKRIRYKALQLDGSEIEREAGGFHARVVQHECDHLDGFLYPMRMEDLSTLAYTDEMNRNELPLGERIKAEKENQEAGNDG